MELMIEASEHSCWFYVQISKYFLNLLVVAFVGVENEWQRSIMGQWYCKAVGV